MYSLRNSFQNIQFYFQKAQASSYYPRTLCATSAIKTKRNTENESALALSSMICLQQVLYFQQFTSQLIVYSFNQDCIQYRIKIKFVSFSVIMSALLWAAQFSVYKFFEEIIIFSLINPRFRLQAAANMQANSILLRWIPFEFMNQLICTFQQTLFARPTSLSSVLGLPTLPKRKSKQTRPQLKVQRTSLFELVVPSLEPLQQGMDLFICSIIEDISRPSRIDLCRQTRILKTSLNKVIIADQKPIKKVELASLQLLASSLLPIPLLPTLRGKRQSTLTLPLLLPCSQVDCFLSQLAYQLSLQSSQCQQKKICQAILSKLQSAVLQPLVQFQKTNVIDPAREISAIQSMLMAAGHQLVHSATAQQLYLTDLAEKQKSNFSDALLKPVLIQLLDQQKANFSKASFFACVQQNNKQVMLKSKRKERPTNSKYSQLIGNLAKKHEAPSKKSLINPRILAVGQLGEQATLMQKFKRQAPQKSESCFKKIKISFAGQSCPPLIKISKDVSRHFVKLQMPIKPSSQLVTSTKINAAVEAEARMIYVPPAGIIRSKTVILWELSSLPAQAIKLKTLYYRDRLLSGSSQVLLTKRIVVGRQELMLHKMRGQGQTSATICRTVQVVSSLGARCSFQEEVRVVRADNVAEARAQRLLFKAHLHQIVFKQL